jgi:hypothetical protein
MELLWPALVFSVVAVFVFFVLAQRWGRILRHNKWTIRRLTERVHALEQIADPAWRRKLTEASPVPLERVYHFSFHFDDQFWRKTIRLSDADRQFIQQLGTVVGSVKLERWRSHTVATVTEVLPDRKSTGWQSRTLDFYSGSNGSGETLSLWELALTCPDASAVRPPTLELLLRSSAIELRGHLLDLENPLRVSARGRGDLAGDGEVLFFRVPLDPAELAEFRSHDPAEAAGSSGKAARASTFDGSSWQAFYSFRDEEAGIAWQLRLRDLTQKSEWEQWKILDSPAIPVPTRD